MKLFFSCYQRNDVTPYIHVLSAHLHEFKILSIVTSEFTLQGLEKLNDLTTRQFFNATNKHNNKRKSKSNKEVDKVSSMEVNQIESELNHVSSSPLTGEDLTEEEPIFLNNKLWVKQIIELRNRLDEQSFF